MTCPKKNTVFCQINATAWIYVPPALSEGIFPLKRAKIGQKWAKIAQKPLKYSPGAPEFTRVSVNAQGAFIWRNTVHLYGTWYCRSFRKIQVSLQWIWDPRVDVLCSAWCKLWREHSNALLQETQSIVRRLWNKFAAGHWLFVWSSLKEKPWNPFILLLDRDQGQKVGKKNHIVYMILLRLMVWIRLMVWVKPSLT